MPDTDKETLGAVQPKNAEWIILILLGIFGCYHLFTIFVLSDQSGRSHLSGSLAIMSAVLFAVASWAAFRIEKTSAFILTLPLLVVCAIALIDPPDDEIDDLEARISQIEEESIPAVDAKAQAAIDRLSLLRVTVRNQPLVQVADGSTTEDIPGSSEHDFCFITGTYGRYSNDFTEQTVTLTPPATTGPWRVYLSAQNDGGDRVGVRVMCVGLPRGG